MTDEAIWGIFFLIYTVPFFLWQNSSTETQQIRQKLYPGRPDEKNQLRFLSNTSLLWSFGLILAVIGYKSEAHPIPFIGLLLVILGCIYCVAKWLKRVKIEITQKHRYFVAATLSWFVIILGLYWVFGNHWNYQDIEYIYFAVVPVVVGAFIYFIFSWANRQKN